MELIELSQKMTERIDLLEKKRKDLEQLSRNKALTAACYDREITKTIIRLKNGEQMTLDGHNIKNPIGSITEKLAKGLCWQDKLDMDTAEGLYKVELACIEAIKAELNGYQSINRYLKETTSQGGAY
jgi:hypothetical protein